MLAPRTNTTTATMWPPLSMAEPHVCAPIDANGNRTTDGSKVLGWNARNLLSSVTEGVVQQEIQYDGMGRRIDEIKTEGGTVTERVANVWSGLVLAERRDDSSSVLVQFTQYGERIGSTAFFSTTDHADSVRDVVNVGGSRVLSDAYDPFGRLIRSIGHPLLSRFNGMPGNLAGAHAATFRFYDSASATWLSEDPSGFVDGPNLYSYVKNGPINLADPLGLRGIRDMLPACVRRVLEDGEYISGVQGNSRWAHCITTCRLTSECLSQNAGLVLQIGIMKEIGDAVGCLATRNGRTCDSALQPSDFKDNFRGAICALSVRRRSCKEQCENQLLPGDSQTKGPLSGLGSR